MIRTYRVEKSDLMRNVNRSLFELSAKVREAKGLVGAEAKQVEQSGKSTQRQKDDAEIGSVWRPDVLKEMEGLVRNVRTTFPGFLTDEELLQAITGMTDEGKEGKKTGLSKDEAEAVLNGTVDQLPPYEPGRKKRSSGEKFVKLAP